MTSSSSCSTSFSSSFSSSAERVLQNMVVSDRTVDKNLIVSSTDLCYLRAAVSRTQWMVCASSPVRGYWCETIQNE